MFPAFALLAAANLTVTLQRLSELPPEASADRTELIAAIPPGPLSRAVSAAAPGLLHDVPAGTPPGEWVTLLASRGVAVNPHLRALKSLPPRWETPLRGVQPAVASIRDGDHRGSGVNLGPEGLVLTANHVVGSGEVDVHLADGSPWRARVVLRDPVRDLALVALTGGEALPVVRLAPAPPLVADEFVLIGCPVSCDRRPFAPVRGRLLAFRADRDGRQTLGATAHDAGTDWGHSGSPLLNAAGEAIAAFLANADMA